MLTIGILLRRSTLFPSLGIDILNGIKSFLQQQQIKEEFKLITDNIGFGINEAEIYTKAEKLLLQDDADIVITIADIRIEEMLQPLFTASNKLLLMVNFGANFPDNWKATPATIVHSLNFCFHAKLTGKLAAAETNKQAVNVISYYDGGYRQCYSLLNSHQQNGGIPAFNHITHLKTEEFTLAPVADFLQQNEEVKSLLCLFAADMASKFYQEVLPIQKENELSLYVSPMMLDEALKEQSNEQLAVQNTKGYSPWFSSLDNESNKLFTDAFLKTTNKKPNLFALLGWETGLLLDAYLKQHKAGIAGAANIVTAIGNTVFNSPRGWLKLDAATNHTYGPSWLLSCKNNMELTIEENDIDIQNEWNEFTKETLPAGETSSWRNTYLCI